MFWIFSRLPNERRFVIVTKWKKVWIITLQTFGLFRILPIFSLFPPRTEETLEETLETYSIVRHLCAPGHNGHRAHQVAVVGTAPTKRQNLSRHILLIYLVIYFIILSIIPANIKRCKRNLLSCGSEPHSTPCLWKLNSLTLYRKEEWYILHKALINEVPSMTWKRFLTFRLRKWKEFWPSTEGVVRRARRSYRYRGWGHKALLAVSVLAPGASVLPIKLWRSYGCNEVVGTKVAITAQLNCHQRLLEAQDKTLTYLQIEAQILSRHAIAFKIRAVGV